MLARLRGFARDRRGVTALEFALVATPFLMLTFALIEYALIYMMSVTLDSATMDTARLIRTGQAQQSSMTSAQFKAQVCASMGWMSSQCSSNLYVDARVFSNFSSEASPQPVSGGTFDTSKLQFNIGGPGDIVLVTAYYQWPLFTPGFTAAFANMAGNIDVITARAAFRNEPYSGNS